MSRFCVLLFPTFIIWKKSNISQQRDYHGKMVKELFFLFWKCNSNVLTVILLKTLKQLVRNKSNNSQKICLEMKEILNFNIPWNFQPIFSAFVFTNICLPVIMEFLKITICAETFCVKFGWHGFYQHPH